MQVRMVAAQAPELALVPQWQTTLTQLQEAVLRDLSRRSQLQRCR